MIVKINNNTEYYHFINNTFISNEFIKNNLTDIFMDDSLKTSYSYFINKYQKEPFLIPYKIPQKKNKRILMVSYNENSYNSTFNLLCQKLEYEIYSIIILDNISNILKSKDKSQLFYLSNDQNIIFSFIRVIEPDYIHYLDYDNQFLLYSELLKIPLIQEYKNNLLKLHPNIHYYSYIENQSFNSLER